MARINVDPPPLNDPSLSPPLRFFLQQLWEHLLNPRDNFVDQTNQLAGDAQRRASTAQSTADSATGLANTAQASANTAQSTADTAQGAANTAQQSADTAQANATTAQGAADTAQQAANGINQTFSEHAQSNNAHGANGNVVGFNDLATTETVGLVLQAAAVATMEAITPANAEPIDDAPDEYDPEHSQSLVDLTAQILGELQALASAINSNTETLNNLINNLKSAGVMNDPAG